MTAKRVGAALACAGLLSFAVYFGVLAFSLAFPRNHDTPYMVVLGALLVTLCLWGAWRAGVDAWKGWKPGEGKV